MMHGMVLSEGNLTLVYLVSTDQPSSNIHNMDSKSSKSSKSAKSTLEDAEQWGRDTAHRVSNDFNGKYQVVKDRYGLQSGMSCWLADAADPSSSSFLTFTTLSSLCPSSSSSSLSNKRGLHRPLTLTPAPSNNRYNCFLFILAVLLPPLPV